ncbi:MAG: hypothetical protein IKJ87_05070 [Ruminococcus sp.]|nr:hypothetical protein [Ruminococcus sp.]
MAESYKGRFDFSALFNEHGTYEDTFLDEIIEGVKELEIQSNITNDVKSADNLHIINEENWGEAHEIYSNFKKLVERIKKHQRHSVETGEFLSIAKTLRDSRKFDNKFYELTENLSVKINGIVIYGIDNMIEAYENGAEKVGKIKYIPSESDLT